MPENEPNKEEIAGMLGKTFNKYKIFFLSAVGLLVVGVLLFTNYDLGSKLTGYIGQPIVQPQETTTMKAAVKEPVAQPPTQPTAQPPQDNTTQVVAVSTSEAPPSLTPAVSQTPVATLTLTKVTLSSESFNPLVSGVTFTIKTSADAKVDVKIYDKDGNIVSSPASNKDVTGDKEYSVSWEGDDDAKKTLPAGAYSYKVFAKDPLTKEIKDTKTGNLSLKYGTTTATDFENINGKTSGSNSAVPSQPTQSVTTQTIESKKTQSSQNDKATLAMQNSKTGKTAGTGPETIIYLIFPILGYTVSRKFK